MAPPHRGRLPAAGGDELGGADERRGAQVAVTARPAQGVDHPPGGGHREGADELAVLRFAEPDWLPGVVERYGLTPR